MLWNNAYVVVLCLDKQDTTLPLTSWLFLCVSHIVAFVFNHPDGELLIFPETRAPHDLTGETDWGMDSSRSMLTRVEPAYIKVVLRLEWNSLEWGSVRSSVLMRRRRRGSEKSLNILLCLYPWSFSAGIEVSRFSKLSVILFCRRVVFLCCGGAFPYSFLSCVYAFMCLCEHVVLCLCFHWCSWLCSILLLLLYIFWSS